MTNKLNDMKKVMFVLLSLIISESAYSQFKMDLTEDQVTMLAAREICDCFSEAWEEMNLHPRLVSFIQDMGEMGQEKATAIFQEDLMAYDSELQQRIVNDSNKLEKFNMDARCGSINDKYDNLEGSDVEKKMFSYFQDFKSCEMLATFLKIGSN